MLTNGLKKDSEKSTIIQNISFGRN